VCVASLDEPGESQAEHSAADFLVRGVARYMMSKACVHTDHSAGAAQATSLATTSATA